VLRHAAGLGLRKIRVVTNGALLGKRRVQRALWEAAAQTKVRVRVSLNAGCEQTHDRLHGVSGFFPHILAGMKRLRADAERLKLGISFLADETNAAEALRAFELGQQVGATAFFVRPQTSSHGIGLAPLSGRACASLLSAVAAIRSRQQDPSAPRLFVARWYLDYLETGKAPDTAKPYPACYFCGALRLVVTPPEPGVVWSCAYFRSDPRFRVADLREFPFAGPAFGQRRRQAIRRIRPAVDCAGVICACNELNKAIWENLRQRASKRAAFGAGAAAKHAAAGTSAPRLGEPLGARA
jgi:hypothetical protein